MWQKEGEHQSVYPGNILDSRRYGERRNINDLCFSESCQTLAHEEKKMLVCCSQPVASTLN